MCRGIVFCIFMLIGLTVNAQTTVSLSGKVTNSSGAAISNAIVTLVNQGLKDTTGSDGAYSITKSNVSVLQTLVPQTEEIWLNNGFLEFSLTNPSLIKIAIFDVKGNLLKKEVSKNALTGFYRFNIAENSRATNLLIIKASIGQRQMTFRYMPLSSGKSAVSSSGQYATTSTPVRSGLAQVTAISDTLKVTATGYTTKATAITSYSQTVNITLESSSVASDTGRSAGCGKTFSTLTSGTYTIKSSGTNRTYIIKIPSNYDKNNPYRLIFAMHCYGASASIIASTSYRSDGAYDYYGMGTYATNAILVAPQGESSGMWSQGEKDNTFFSDMLRLFKDTLCVDTTRVFSCGFSYGAMFTYSLSLEFQDQLRAVACFAPANYVIYLPTNKHKPLAYYQTTGTSDGRCPWVNSTTSREGGKYCLIDRLVDNGCASDTLNIPIATSSGTHVSTNFCSGKYPVKFGSFVGDHTANNSDNGSSTNWIQKEAWDFFKQF